MRYLVYVIVAAIILAIAPESLSAGCGAASCPLNHHKYLRAGYFNVMLTREYINQDQIYVGSQKSFVGSIRGHHDEVQTINERTMFQMQIGLSDRLGLNVEAPFVSRQHSHIHHHHGEDIFEYWNFSGFGDVVVSGQFALLLPSAEFDPYLSIQAGVKLPTGVTNIKNANGDEAEVTIQPGTGSTDAIIGFYYRQTIASLPTFSGDFSALPITAGVTYQLNGKGTYDYQFGDIMLAHIGTAYQFSSNASLLLQINGRKQDFADVGTTHEPGENTGGVWVYVSPGLNLDLGGTFSAYSYIQLPIYQNVHGIQQASAFNLQFGLTANVSLLN